MFPILYESIERDSSRQQAPKLVVPQHHGLGTLSSCISCTVEQERNGKYELVMEYSASGIHASEIANRRILKVKPNFTDPPQLFRIDRIGKTMNGKFTVYAKHISYDISGYLITGGEAVDAESACILLTNGTNKDFRISTTKQVIADFSIKEPSSVKSWFAGKEGSFLDVFGTAEIKYNNFDVSFPVHAGEDRGVTIRYGKNLLELSQEIDASNLYTAVVCYYKSDEAGLITSNQYSTGLVLDVPKVLAVDVTQEFQETPTQEQINYKAQDYISSHNLTIPSNNITLDFVQSGDLTNRVDLCDTVSVYYEALGITRAEVKCIRTKYDCLREKYIETEFGDVKINLADTISDSTARVDEAVSAAGQAVNAVGSKKRVFINEPVPPYDEGDLWTDLEKIYVCVMARQSGEFNQEDWQEATNYQDKSDLDLAIARATELITGTSSGLVILHDNNGDGSPDEILITSDNDFHSNTARLWRWNASGLGYSSTGYDGTYTDAFYIDENGYGHLNASFIAGEKLDAQEANLQNLTANMFEGGRIVLGGSDVPEGKIIILNQADTPLIQIDTNGLECFGTTVGGITPSVVFDKNGVTAYSNSADKANTAIFWTKQDSFHMTKAVVENEISACGMVKMIPITIRNSSQSITNKGLAFVSMA